MDMPIPDEFPSDLKQAGDILTAAQDVMDKISSFISPKTRGIVIQISNLTGLTLALKTTDFSSGGLEPSVLPAPLVGPFSLEGPCFLDGRTGNGTTGLAPSVHPPFTGTHWGIFRR